MPLVPHRLRHLASFALAGLLLVSCGRALPTASTPAAGGRQAAAASRGGEDLLDAVVIVAPGASAADVAATFGATLLEDEAGVARMLPQSGESAIELCTRMAGSADPRLVTMEQNAALEPAEMRAQEPFATDDGNGSPHTYEHQPAAEALGLADAHLASRGAGVKAAILDTGIDPAHPAFAGRVAAAWDFVSGDADPSENGDGIDNDGDGHVDEAVGHGTHVAGIVALTAPASPLLVARVLDSDGRGNVAGVARAVRWAIDHGARVINLSLGMLKNSDALQHVMSEAEAQGILVVASAGNLGTDNPREFPGTSSHASAVAATDAGATPASFTSYGPQVALCAPGVNIRSAFPGGGYRVWNGTSMSAPFVAGTAALLYALHPQWTTIEVLDRLAATARPLVHVNSSMQGRLGAGMLDAGAALAPDRRDGGDPTVSPGGAPGEITPSR